MRKPILVVLFVASLGPGALAAGCKEEAECFDTLSCPPADATTGGGTSGSGGTSTGGGAGTSSSSTGGSGGASSTGSSTASSGGSTASSGGMGGTLGGASGAGGAPADCDGACGDSTPVCDTATDTCVECLDSTDHCDAPTPVCNPESHACVECLDNDDCDAAVCDPATHQCVECLETNDCESPTPLCDTEQQLCAECLDNADCTDPLEATCDAGSCSPCQSNADCEHLTETTVCDVTEGECVECTGTDYASCGVNDDEEPLVCDSLTRTCAAEVEHDRGLCEPCLADANCALGQLCAMQTFEEQELGYFCFWERGASEGGAPAGCGTARPYVDTLATTTSIDGTVADVCGLRTSTCVARSQFSDKPCGTTTPDDSLCGVAPPADAICVEFDTDVHRCTMTCLSSDDCPIGSSCNTAVANPYCEL